MEAAAAKQARTARGSAPDRLSALSDELLCHVLSFLPSRQAVQTTVLSKSSSDFRGGHWWRKLQDFTNNLLMLNNARCLDAFRLDLFWATEFPDLCRDTERWVRRGIKCQPPVFQIRVYRDIFRYHFQIPRLGSGFHLLKSLELAFLDNELDKFPMFDNLRTLSLSYCFFSERDADKLKALGRFLHKSPNLEELILQDFWMIFCY
uniref:F-box domain-containing protein n=1 Tax=Setaria italica TaxID=4555 RepID=K3Z9P9_SETIT